MEKLKIINFSERALKKFPELQLSNKIVNTEAKLYVYKEKTKWQKEDKLLKIFYNSEPENMANKVFVLGQLMQLKKRIQFEELVFPEALVSVNQIVVGYVMPWIRENINMSLLLQNKNVSLQDKIGYLKQIYLILKDLKVKQKKENNPFYLGDIHESNFIFNIDSQKIQAIDLDSGYFLGALAPTSKFLTFNENLWNYSIKYPIDIRNDRHIPNDNTTILSFIYIFLNTISESKSYKWNYEQFYTYLEFLYRENVDPEFLDVLSSIYSDEPTINFHEKYLESFDVERNYVLQRK